MAKNLKASVCFMLRSGRSNYRVKSKKSIDGIDSSNSGNFLRRLVIRVSFLGKQKQWSVGDIWLTSPDFKRLTNIQSKIAKQEHKDLQIEILAYNKKAKEICKELGSSFTFDYFEEMFFNTKQVRNSNMKILDVYELYITKKGPYKEIQTIRGYSVLRNHIMNYDPNLRLNQINTEFPIKFMKYLIGKGATEPTSGVYLRYLRSLYNFAVEQRIIKDDIKPFLGFKIPNTRRRKLALSTEVLEKLKYHVPNCEKQAKALDLFWFSFECSGINFKDLAFLKYSDLVDNRIMYYRQKIKNSKADDRRYTENKLTTKAMDTISKWGNERINENDYIFPFLNNTISKIEQQRIVDQLIESTNKQLAKLSKELNLNIKITTNYARHSYASFLQSKGFTTEVIGDKLQHYGDLKTTKIYMASLPNDLNDRIYKFMERI
jgi:site-specific recombinase XerD